MNDRCQNNATTIMATTLTTTGFAEGLRDSRRDGTNFALSGVEIAEHAKPEICGGSIPLGRMVTLPFRVRGQTCLRGHKPDSRCGDRPECIYFDGSMSAQRQRGVVWWTCVRLTPGSSRACRKIRVRFPTVVYFNSGSTEGRADALRSDAEEL